MNMLKWYKLKLFCTFMLAGVNFANSNFFTTFAAIIFACVNYKQCIEKQKCFSLYYCLSFCNLNETD